MAADRGSELAYSRWPSYRERRICWCAVTDQVCASEPHGSRCDPFALARHASARAADLFPGAVGPWSTGTAVGLILALLVSRETVLEWPIIGVELTVFRARLREQWLGFKFLPKTHTYALCIASISVPFLFFGTGLDEVSDEGRLCMAGCCVLVRLARAGLMLSITAAAHPSSAGARWP